MAFVLIQEHAKNTAKNHWMLERALKVNEVLVCMGLFYNEMKKNVKFMVEQNKVL